LARHRTANYGAHLWKRGTPLSDFTPGQSGAPGPGFFRKPIWLSPDIRCGASTFPVRAVRLGQSKAWCLTCFVIDLRRIRSFQRPYRWLRRDDFLHIACRKQSFRWRCGLPRGLPKQTVLSAKVPQMPLPGWLTGKELAISEPSPTAGGSGAAKIPPRIRNRPPAAAPAVPPVQAKKNIPEIQSR